MLEQCVVVGMRSKASLDNGIVRAALTAALPRSMLRSAFRFTLAGAQEKEALPKGQLAEHVEEGVVFVTYRCAAFKALLIGPSSPALLHAHAPRPTRR